MRVNPIEKARICFEDNHLIIINKLAGEIVQGDSSETVPMSDRVKEYIKVKYNKPGSVFLGVVHRIDQPTSGLVIFAKTSKALSRINLMLKNREVVKKYLALVHEVPEEDKMELCHYLWHNPKNNKTTIFPNEAENSKIAKLSFETLKKSNRYALLEVNLETGRHHQIRSQMQAIGHPVKNDRKYGAKRIDSIYKGIFLHAHELILKHPVSGEIIKIKAPIPWPIEEVEKFGLDLKNL